MDLRESARCVLDDGSASAALDLMEAEVVVVAAPRVRNGIYSVPSRSSRSSSRASAAPRTRPRDRTCASAKKYCSKATFSMPWAPRAGATAAGTLAAEDGPYVVSDRDEAEVVRHQRRAGRRWTAIGMASLVLLGWGLFQVGPSILGS